MILFDSLSINGHSMAAEFIQNKLHFKKLKLSAHNIKKYLLRILQLWHSQ